ncbi:MAG: hypothetical protein V7605_2498 [Acidimicrobiaceae bacterium]
MDVLRRADYFDGAMAILVVLILVVLAAAAGGVYALGTRPCENGFHRRHWRFRRFQPGGCSAVD